ncbi:diguanylate cyclase [Salinicola sp. JS01]|uniref:GGDEF domain-containing protein n=1 Tax=Salinicola sp. JS01 TaxID=3050071 RepID=UPI00255BA151|nr:GGDEF domain-containing protein [Salinicola sp. JS01]WIX31341.1 diguanylate cyclase [Salinicola sp. JS01]
MRVIGAVTGLCVLLIGMWVAWSWATREPQGETPSVEPSGWEYRWGDSPRDGAGLPAWLHASDSGWQPIAFPADPPQRDGRDKVWFRLRLPHNQWHDPVLFVSSIDLIAQVYLDDRLIYQHGDFNDGDHVTFVGWPWHMIALPHDFGGQTLWLRVFSDYTSIGLWGQVRLMERGEAYRQIIRRSAWDVAVSALALALSVFAAIFAVSGVERRSFGAIALFAGASGLMLLAEAPARQLIAGNPLGWDLIRAFSYYMLPVATGLILAHWLKGSARRWMRRLWALHLAYVVLVVGLVQGGVINLSLTFPIFDMLLVLTLPTMLALALWQWRALDGTQRTVVLSFAVFAPLLLADILVAHGFIPWQPIPLSFGTLAFSLSCVAISLHRYHRVHRELARSHETLEQQVALRTAELAGLVEELEGLSYRDALTGLYNRRHFDAAYAQACRRAMAGGECLTLAIVDLDHFKRINDRFGHDAGDSVLVEVATLLKASKEAGESVCRLGGEEFALLSHASPTALAARLERLLGRLAAAPLKRGDLSLGRVTFSAGIASFPMHSASPDGLLRLADEALYCAKRDGRSTVTIYSASAEPCLLRQDGEQSGDCKSHLANGGTRHRCAASGERDRHDQAEEGTSAEKKSEVVARDPDERRGER